MPMLRLFSLFFLGFLLSGCANSAGYEAKLAQWTGQKQQALVQSWGTPDKIEAISDTKSRYIYDRTRIIKFEPAEIYQSTASGPKQYTNSYTNQQAQEYILRCVTVFTIEEEVIRDFAWQGKGCKSV